MFSLLFSHSVFFCAIVNTFIWVIGKWEEEFRKRRKELANIYPDTFREKWGRNTLNLRVLVSLSVMYVVMDRFENPSTKSVFPLASVGSQLVKAACLGKWANSFLRGLRHQKSCLSWLDIIFHSFAQDLRAGRGPWRSSFISDVLHLTGLP